MYLVFPRIIDRIDDVPGSSNLGEGEEDEDDGEVGLSSSSDVVMSKAKNEFTEWVIDMITVQP